MTWISEHAALCWLAVAIVLALLEVLSLDFFFVTLAAGALAGALASWFGASGTVSVLTAAGVAMLLLLLGRPVLVRRFGSSPPHQTGTAALVGRLAEVTEPVADAAGRVKLAGEIWSARTEDAIELGVGAKVRVLRIEGATAIVTQAE